MGRSSNFLCRTCKKNISLGYGSYTTWLDNDAKTVAEYDALPDTNKDIQKNKNFRKTLAEHEDHDWTLWSEDFVSNINGNLVVYWTDEIIATDFDEYEHVVL